ncbi:hypothetical protein F0562_004140 [Nyssa sinensis]|uniref:GTD-binding domain-containing protein n=1 Tax=Nyssa sinensis TaxID=561372 RepID=A0A5J5C2H9_9ASTE|nr:hypothetical protein F0562_004140 [Nyssa sinensis]
MDGLHHLHKKLLLFEKRESGTEESWDGSVISEMEGGDGAFTIERLKSALKSERKALSALYAELEEERSAAAIAANQTMAMITRLQEEKAAMQMEALQYQRMMEEQSEYDQEALQLLNELMIKREKEKQELEKELEMYRKKVLDYEAKEKMVIVRKRDGSVRKFEEERLSILEELKALEEKLFTLGDDEEQLFEDVRPIDHFADDYCKEFSESFDFSSPDENEVSNVFSEVLNGKHCPENKIMGSKARRLLPLFDETSIITEEGELNGEHIKSDSTKNGIQNSLVSTFELENKKLAIEEEVDHVYERLQALEADREFLKHCISSLKKGDKGMDLLQEILQHLRDLRTVELRVRNMGDDPLL